MDTQLHPKSIKDIKGPINFRGSMRIFPQVFGCSTSIIIWWKFHAMYSLPPTSEYVEEIMMLERCPLSAWLMCLPGQASTCKRGDECVPGPRLQTCGCNTTQHNTTQHNMLYCVFFFYNEIMMSTKKTSDQRYYRGGNDESTWNTKTRI